ncbi:DUF3152 domain-containing protein [Arsenicicoccus piscis]|uniref:DUF3152 domain-containing protein n=1 Tax=Arsenicicoccus piscis TaxID=673954 RepID=A0ABQ6HLS4_9MICO|nr:DUF3152 domain-containing protein [Arsenicicoccus piscis]MCH8626975.1 DUF3152 domain-containing protein [Arsenicicoccus piscis]GMA19102.1 hypothetical protein GCM10025862_11230 [Arsenicicoccus piscis]
MSRLDEHIRPSGVGRPEADEDPWPEHVVAPTHGRASAASHPRSHAPSTDADPPHANPPHHTDAPRPARARWSTRRRLRLLRTVVVGGLLVAGGSYGVGQLTSQDSQAVSANRTAAVAPAAPGAAQTGTAQTDPAARSTPTGSGDDVAEGDGIGPTPASVPRQGNGQFTVLPVPGPDTAGAGGRMVRYTVEIEGGLSERPADYARTVQQTLQDPRGWRSQDSLRFINVSPDQAAGGAKVDLRILLATPATVDRLCAPLETRGTVSCFNGGRAVLNAARYVGGATTFGTDVTTYRVYQINHEVGHGLGHGHQGCPAPGTPAPIMLQQTKYLLGCTANPYPTVP